jgi:hypothetical protein
MDRISSNGIPGLLSGSSYKNFDSRKPKDIKVTVFVTIAPMYSVLLETSVSQFALSLRSIRNTRS